jgi:hypothetical protein
MMSHVHKKVRELEFQYPYGLKRRLGERFPELMEIIRIASEVEDELDAVVGDLVPTVRPRTCGHRIPVAVEGDTRETV